MSFGVSKTANTDAVEAVRIDLSGNVGIGTTAPAYPLDVSGAGRFTSDLYGGVDIYTAAAIRFNGTGLNATDKKLYSPADGDLEWMTHNQAGVHGFAVSHQGTKAVYLNISGNSYFNGGNLGIGTTSPGAKLEVAGNGTGKILIGDIGGYTNYAGISLNGSTTAGYYNILSRASDGTLLLNRPFGDIAFYENNSALHMIIKGTSGNVGIGTTAPSANGLTIRREGGDRKIMLELNRPNEAGLQSAIQFTVGSSILVGQIQHEYASSNYNHMSFTLRSPGGSDFVSLWLENSGNVGIGTTAPAYALEVVGTIRASSDVIAFSDARVKDNVQTITDALTKVTSLRGVTYTRNDMDDKSEKIGVIAQEVLPILPQVVQKDTNGNYSVAYGNIVGVLIEAIKELKAEIDILKQK